MLELARRGLGAVEVGLQLCVIARDDLLGHLLMEAVLFLGDVGREVLVVTAPRLVVDECALAQDVGDAVELVLLADRQLDRPQRRAEGRPQLLHGAAEVGAGTVLLRHRDDPRNTGGTGARPRGARAAGHAVHGAHDDDSDIGDRERRVHGPDEVGVSRRVDECDAVFHVGDGPGEPCERESEGRAAGDLLRLVVADGRPLLDAAHSRYRAGAMQQSLGERRLAASHRAQQRDGAMGGGIRCGGQ